MTNGVLPALELVELQVGLLVAEPAALGAQLLLFLHLVQEGLGQGQELVLAPALGRKFMSCCRVKSCVNFLT